LREKQKAAQKLEQEINKLIATEIKAAADRAKKNRYVRNPKDKHESGSTEILLTNDEQVLSSSFASNKGKLPWPSEHGVITSTLASIRTRF
jgi:septal ring factor EnvC (AmiA/AmiB activator)